MEVLGSTWNASQPLLPKLMRHASIQMTMTYYVHLGTAELHKGLGQLAGVEPRRATQ